MVKNFIKYLFVWSLSVFILAGGLVLIQKSGMFPQLFPEKAMANPDCDINDNLSVSGNTLFSGGDNYFQNARISTLRLNGVRSVCGTCNSTNAQEIIACDTGGDCPDWGLEICAQWGTVAAGFNYGWRCLGDY